jgi:hypothetical protein
MPYDDLPLGVDLDDADRVGHQRPSGGTRLTADDAAYHDPPTDPTAFAWRLIIRVGRLTWFPAERCGHRY